MVSMEAGRACGYRDDSSRVPALSLGLSSVRRIVKKFESQYTRVSSEEHLQLATYDPNIEKGCDDFPLDQSRRRVFFEALGLCLTRWIPSVTFGNFGVLAVTTGLFAPKMLSYLVVYPFCRLVFGTLYPAYASYKAVRTKNLKEYVKWMMYWIVFALFTCTETFTDVFLSWFPFYYEVKIVLVLWLLSPATKGSSILYRKFVHPALCRREQEIDEYIAKAKDQGYHTVLNLGTKGVNYATTVIMQTAIKGGGGLVQQIRKSYSLSDLTECAPCDERSHDEADDVMTEPRLIRRVPKSGYTPRRSASESATRSPMYFPEVDVDVRPRPRSDEPDFSHIKSTEDISSGYSSADNSASLTRTASLGARARRTARTQVTAIKRPQAAEESEVIIEELQDDEFDYANMPSLVNLPAQIFISHTDPPFLYQYVGDQVRIIQVLGDDPLLTKSNENIEKNTGENTIFSDKDVNATEKTVQIEEATNETFDKTIEPIKDSFENAIKPTTESSENTIELTKESDTVSDIKKSNETSILEPVEVTENYICDRNKVTNVKVNLAESESTIKEKDYETVVVYDENIKETTGTSKETSQNTMTTYDTTTLSNVTKPDQNTTDLNASLDEDNSAESGDDEASFGTPDNSPKSKRKLTKGKYGKGKAPPPPITDNITSPVKEDFKTIDQNVSNTNSQESLDDLANRMPKTAIKETVKFHRERSFQVVNPIAENKKRHKSKSPRNIPKGNTTTIGRLLQLPGKLAFWNKTDDTNISKSDVSELSDHSRRSSNIDQGLIDEFQSCADLTKITPLETNERAEDQITFKDAIFESEDMTQDIIDKSDALQKLIEAKIESHPEYKIVALHAEIPTASKSTDV